MWLWGLSPMAYSCNVCLVFSYHQEDQTETEFWLNHTSPWHETKKSQSPGLSPQSVREDMKASGTLCEWALLLSTALPRLQPGGRLPLPCQVHTPRKAMWAHSKMVRVCKLGKEPSPGTETAGTLKLDFPASTIVRGWSAVA
ncbi:uncharacterized protein LOC134737900 isoform X3 [Pongo pygmaeus]|uniref:uncharacterized protein LOC134737900 isoform X3 n=1 Tax=Pongo pygmaeus TaxID=9600 RepID=UPI00300C1061